MQDRVHINCYFGSMEEFEMLDITERKFVKKRSMAIRFLVISLISVFLAFVLFNFASHYFSERPYFDKDQLFISLNILTVIAAIKAIFSFGGPSN